MVMIDIIYWCFCSSVPDTVMLLFHILDRVMAVNTPVLYRVMVGDTPVLRRVIVGDTPVLGRVIDSCPWKGYSR